MSFWILIHIVFIALQENPDAKLEDLEKPGVDEEPQQVLLRWDRMLCCLWLIEISGNLHFVSRTHKQNPTNLFYL